MSIFSGSLGAVLNAKTQEEANKINRQNAQDTNALNKQMWEESRGSGGSAVLPLYLRTKEGNLFESQLGQDLMDAYENAGIPLSDFQNLTQRYQPMAESAKATADDIFNGGTEAQMLEHLAPVKAARVAYSRQGAMDALNDTLGEIQAAQSAKGYTGDSLGNRMMTFAANKQAGDQVSAANLQNLQDERNIKDSALNLKLQNLNLPNQMAQNATALLQMPTDAYIDSVMKGMQPLSFLRIGGSQPFQYSPMPTVQATPGAAQLALQGVSQMGNTALDAWLKSRQQNDWLNALKNQQANAMMQNTLSQGWGAGYTPAQISQWEGTAGTAGGVGGGFEPMDLEPLPVGGS